MCEPIPLSAINQGGNMSPAPRESLLVRDLELARRLLFANQPRPFWHERQLATEANGGRKLGKTENSPVQTQSFKNY